MVLQSAEDQQISGRCLLDRIIYIYVGRPSCDEEQLISVMVVSLFNRDTVGKIRGKNHCSHTRPSL